MAIKSFTFICDDKFTAHQKKIKISRFKPALILTLIMSALSRQAQHFGSSTQLYFRSVYLFHIYAEATRAGAVHTN